MTDKKNSNPELIWITGFSQGGTTLLMSLLDGHPDLLVYPDEPAFGKLFKRQNHYVSLQHFIADFLFGTTNHLHFAQEAGTENVKNKTYPAAIEADYNKIHNIFSEKWVENKRLRGLELNSDFDQVNFFLNYHNALLDKIKKITEINAKDVVRVSFEALNKAYPVVASNKRVRTFKGPLSSVYFHKLDWFRENYNGKIIFIHRNPYARLYSKIMHLRKKGRPARAPRLRESFFGFMRLCNANARDYSQSVKISKEKDIISIYYEDLVNDCEKTMRYICKKLKIHFHEF